MNRLSFALATALLVFTRNAQAQTYINYAPDLSWAGDDFTSRITLVVDKDLFGYGHSYGMLGRCRDGDSSCMTVDFMALRPLPVGAEVGSSYKEGPYAFRVSRAVDLAILGHQLRTLRVDVTKDGKAVNAYLFERERGIVAIMPVNFGVKGIPESIYLLEGERGVFAEAPR